MQELAQLTQGYSGSDLFELCAQAAVIPVHEFVEAIDRCGTAGPERKSY